MIRKNEVGKWVTAVKVKEIGEKRGKRKGGKI
jgi:hypothetical protein